jgi:hypothetical protein
VGVATKTGTMIRPKVLSGPRNSSNLVYKLLGTPAIHKVFVIQRGWVRVRLVCYYNVKKFVCCTRCPKKKSPL